MDAANQRIAQFNEKFLRYMALAWYSLRSPKTTAALLGLLAVVLVLGLIIPRQAEAVSGSDTTPAAWITGLPLWLQSSGEVLFWLGFSGIFQTLWFWLPAALLLLNSLIALADYVPGSWQRLGKVTPSIDWQHPLARRVEHTVRLTESPNEFLESRKRILDERGFSLYQPVESGQWVIGAARHRWAWLGVVAAYAGLIVLTVAFLISHYSLKTERFTLLPAQPKSSSLFKGKFELTNVDAARGMSQVTYTPAGVGQSPQTLTWRLYWPSFLNNTLILPVAIEPVLTVEVRDRTGALLKLLPLPEDLSPAGRLSVPLNEANSPLYFAIPAEDLAFQISPDPTNENNYDVQVRRGAEASLVENMQVQAGQQFQVDTLTAVLFLDYDVQVFARRDWALPFYVISAILVIGGGVFTFLRSPVQLWLVPLVKGLGGQLYGVMEKFGFEEEMNQFLEDLLALEVLLDEQ